MSTEKSLATERIKQKKLFKIRILLFGCRKYLPKNALSGDSLVCTPKSSQLVDVSSCMSDMDRIPAGSAPCGCPTADSARSSSQNLSTREVSTQTEDDDMKSISEAGPDALTQSGAGAGRKDAGTQLSFSELSNNSSSRAFIQVQYSNVSKKFQSPCNLVGEEDELQSETPSIREEITQKFFRRPLIVVDGNQISGASAPPRNPPPTGNQPARSPTGYQPARSPTGNQPTRSQPQRGQAIRNQPPRGQQQQPRRDAKSSRSRDQHRPVKGQSAVIFEPSNQNMQYQHDQQVPPGGTGTMNSTLPGGTMNPTLPGGDQMQHRPMKQDEQTQSEKNTSMPGSIPCSRIPELLERVCQLEAKSRQQERSLRGLQCSMKSSNSSKCGSSQPPSCKCMNQATQKSNCSLQNSAKSCKSSASTCNQPPKESCKPSKSCNQPPKSCCCEPPKPACPPKCEEKKPDCKALKKEFIDIFTKKDPTECTKKDCEKPITICARKSECIDGRKMCLQCLENSNVLMQQFNHMFVNPGSQGFDYNLNKYKRSKTPSLEQFEQVEAGTEEDICLTERESKIENELDECVDLEATKSDGDVSSIGMASSASYLPKNNDPNQLDSRQLQKEVYESLMEQFVKYFTKKKTESGLTPLPAQKAEEESYSFERLCDELISLISKTNHLESSGAMNEDKLKLVNTSTSNKVLEKDQAGCQDNCISERNEKPRTVEYVGNDPPVPPGGSDNGNHLPVLDSLVDEMTNLIGSRPFHHVVLTIMRRGCNVYNINIRERATGNVLGSLLANRAAVNEGISLGLFEDIPTFCELDRQRSDDPIATQREPGGETQLAKRDKAKAMEFVTRVLGLPVGEAERFFSLTSALKTAKKSSDQSLGGTELSRVTESTSLIGRGAVTDNLIVMGTTGSQLDVSELGEASKHFLRLLSGLETEDNDKF